MSRQPRKAWTTIIVMVMVLSVVVGVVAIWQWMSLLKPEPKPLPMAGCEANVENQQAWLSIEQSGNAAIIAGIAAQRELAPRAVSIALTTAFQESQILNLDYGDRDSLGIFQQRPSQGWGTPEQVMDPYYSTGKFYDAMVEIDDWANADIGDVAQAVQRSAFPDAYDQHVTTARLLASALSGQTPAAWSCVVAYQDQTPDPDQLFDALTQAYGSAIKARAIPNNADNPAQIMVDATTTEVAWSVAAFAQSWASPTGVSEVNVFDMQWQASTTELATWVDNQESLLDPTTVMIVF